AKPSLSMARIIEVLIFVARETSSIDCLRAIRARFSCAPIVAPSAPSAPTSSRVCKRRTVLRKAQLAGRRSLGEKTHGDSHRHFDRDAVEQRLAEGPLANGICRCGLEIRVRGRHRVCVVDCSVRANLRVEHDEAAFFVGAAARRVHGYRVYKLLWRPNVAADSATCRPPPPTPAGPCAR